MSENLLYSPTVLYSICTEYKTPFVLGWYCYCGYSAPGLEPCTINSYGNEDRSPQEFRWGRRQAPGQGSARGDAVEGSVDEDDNATWLWLSRRSGGCSWAKRYPEGEKVCLWFVGREFVGFFGSFVTFLLTQIFGTTVDNASAYVTKWYVFHINVLVDFFLRMLLLLLQYV